jgi:hypothetical protein
MTEATVGRGISMTEGRGGCRGLAGGLAVAGLLGAALAAMAGCSAPGPAGPAGPTGHQTAGPPAVPPQASCGEAVTHDLSSITQVFHADTGALSCFATAVRQCASASIAITEMGIDTGTRYVFAVVPGQAPCQATEWSQFYSANPGGEKDGSVAVTRCSATAGPGGVMLGCGGQDILIPVTVTSSATVLDP